MEIIDRIDVAAPIDRVFDAAAQVERWPAILPHYRFVTVRERRPDRADIVEMSAHRPFGWFNWPTWWTSEMWIDRPRYEVRYRHVRGVTRAMNVVWRLSAQAGGTHIELIHAWDGPQWPLIGRWAARSVILPVFVHGIAQRTLAGIKRSCEAGS